MKLRQLFKSKPHSARLKAQRGFLAAPILFGILASFAAISLAGSYVGIFDKLIESQKNIQARNKLQQLANLMVDSNADPINGRHGLLKVGPPMSLTPGGAPLDSETPAPSQEDGGRLPSGFSGITRMGDAHYYSYIHMPRSTDTAPPGYYLSGRGGIPHPDTISFALILPGKDGLYDTTDPARIQMGLTSGDDVGVFKTVRDVNPEAYKNLLENAGNIPTCGIKTDPDTNAEYHTTLKWNIDEKKWECVRSNIPEFLLKKENAGDNLTACATGQALTMEQNSTTGQLEMRCISTTAARPRSEYGLVMGDDGTINSIIDAGVATSSACTPGPETMIWNGTQIICNGNARTPYVASCPAGRWLGTALSRYTACIPFNAESIGRHAAAGARAVCNGGVTPYYSDNRTYCPEDPAGGRTVCDSGFEVAFIGNLGGFGCYLPNDPTMAAGLAETRAVHHATAETCPAGSVMQILADDRNYFKCVGIMEALSFAMPAAACPAVTGKAGALTYANILGVNRFTCTIVD